MAKIFTYLIIITGLMVLFNAAGLTTTTGYALGQLGLINPDSVADYQGSTAWLWVIGAVTTLSAITAVLISITTRTPYTTTLSASFAASILVFFIGDLVSIVQTVGTEAEWAKWLLYLIVSPLVVGFSLSIWDWVRSSGSD